MHSPMNLPEDAFTEILLRLPVKSLVRFSCVSKSWFTLLKSPYFIDMHLKFSLARDDEHILIAHYDRKEREEVLSFHSNDDSLSVLAPNLVLEGFHEEIVRMLLVSSCNGIICFSNRGSFILCNPALREFREIFHCPFRCPEGFYDLEGVGFGFDSNRNDYKFIRIVRLHAAFVDDPYKYDPPFHRAQIYNLRNNSWREVDAILPDIESNFIGSTLLFNGTFHWYALDWDGNLILSWNISTEVFHTFRFPEPCRLLVGEPQQSAVLSIIQDTFAVILFVRRHCDLDPQFINIWVMKEYGLEESWTKLYCIGTLSGIECPISIWRNKWLLLESYSGEWIRPAQLVAFDLLNSEHEQVRKYDIYGREGTFAVAFYKETLLSIAEESDGEMAN